MPAALLGPLYSSGFLSSPNILIVGKPRTPYLLPRDLCSSAFTAPTFTTPCKTSHTHIHIHVPMYTYKKKQTECNKSPLMQ